MGLLQLLIVLNRVNLGAMAMKGYVIYPKVQELESHHQMEFSVKFRTLVVGEGDFFSTELRLGYFSAAAERTCGLFPDKAIGKDFGEFMSFLGVSSPKINVMAQLEFELAYYDVTVKHISNYNYKPSQWMMCPWCNGYPRRNWTRRHEFKSWTDCISHSTNTRGKTMNPIILPPAMGK